jgi:aspartyl-tRNA(Asn)/glutamyl-tRNA(Gln) amidotransferase subunit B
LLEDGGEVVQETVLWDAERNVAVPMRTKEEAHDYRYFPDPDLVPVEVAESWIGEIRKQLPELPAVRRDRFMAQWGLPRYDAEVLTAGKDRADYFEESLSHLSNRTGGAKGALAKTVGNWVMTEVLRAAGERREGLGAFPVSPSRLAALIALVKDGTLSGKTAKEVFELMISSKKEPREIAESAGLLQVSDADTIEAAVAKVLADHPDQVNRYLEGSVKIKGFLIGEVMKATGGKANPALVHKLLDDRLASRKG